MFGRKKKVSEEMPLIDIKGNKINYSSGMDVSQGAFERQMYEVDRGPRMLPRKQRFKAWGALLTIGGWFFFCFCWHWNFFVIICHSNSYLRCR